MKVKVARFLVVALGVVALGCGNHKGGAQVIGQYTRYGVELTVGEETLPTPPEASMTNIPSVVRLEKANGFEIEAGDFRFSGKYRLLLLSLSIAVVIVACGSASQSSPSGRCTLLAADTVYFKRGPVYRACGVDQRAEGVNKSFRPDFRPDGSQSCYSAVIEFVVDETGHPEMEDAKVLRSNNPAFADALKAAAAQWTYKPALRDGVPVRQIVEEGQRIATSIVAVPAGQAPRPPARMPNC